MAVTDVDVFTHLTDLDIENLAVELDAIRQDVEDSRGERDSRYIRRTIAAQRALEVSGRLLLAASSRRSAWWAGTVTLGVAKIVSEVIAKFFDRALRANIDLGVDAAPVSIHANPSLLDDLLSNLVDNALKYTPAAGSVTASAGLQNGKPFLAVEDTGPGIPETERQRVRQRFYRMPNSPGHGSGLGLAIVDEIAHLYGASVSIEGGAKGVGTRVIVLFP